MPGVGELPITSYFTRVPQKTKRKENPPKRSAPAKRKRLHEDELEEGERSKKEPKIQGSLTFSRAIRKTARTTSHSSVPPPRHDGTPSTSLPYDHYSASAFPGPPLRAHTPANPTPVARKRLALPHVSPTSYHDTINGVVRPSPPPSPQASSRLTIPSSPPRIPTTVKGKSVAFARLLCTHAKDVFDKAPDVPHKDTSDEDDASSHIVPSSQSQYIPSPNPATPSLPGRSSNLCPPGTPSYALQGPIPSSQSQYVASSHNSSRWNRSSSVDTVPSSQSQYIPATPAPVERDDDGFVVPSSQSQSQWLPPVYVNGEDDLRPSVDVMTCVADDEIIPSSQSQFEVELVRRPRESYGEPSHLSLLPVQSPKPPVGHDHDIDVETMFEDPFVATTDCALVTDKADSETESDEDFPPPPRPLEPIHISSPEQEEPSGYVGSPVHSSPNDGCGSAASSAASLPAVVQDFYDMFGSGDDSYPGDFPESLKWRGGETQE